MDKVSMYRGAIDAAVFIRHFMYSENHFFRSLDFALQPFIEEVSDSLKEMTSKHVVPDGLTEKDSK